jgi:hypothetical protein
MAFFKIIASELGDDTGPFVIKSNTGATLATGVSRTQLLDGFTVNVPVGVTSVTIENDPSNTTCTTTQTLPIPNEGSWEMERLGVETISDHYGVLFNAYTAPVETFVSDSIVGIYAGVVSGTGLWTIKGTAEDVAGTTYDPGGLLIITGVNTNTSTTVESGAKLQIGYDTDSYTGRTGASLTVAAGATVDVVGANEHPGRVSFGNLINNDVVTITGPDRCGEGYFRNAGNITQNNGASIVLNKAALRLNNPTTFASTGGGIIDVKDGSTLEANGVSIPSNHTLKLAGCGKCNEIGTQDGALLVGTNGTNIGATLELQSDVCFDHVGAGQVTMSGRINGDHKITLNNKADNTARAGTWSFTSGATPFFDNTLEVRATSLYNTGTNALSKADVVLLGTGFMQQDGGVVNLGSLSSSETTTGILANSSVTIVLKENGSTTFAGSMSNSTPGTPWNFRIEGPDTNVIKLTHPTGNATVNLNSTLGGRIIVENGRYRQWNGVGTISAGSTRSSGPSFVNSRIDLLTLGANSALDVYASGDTTGMLTGGTTSAAAGWKVNLMEPLPAGTHQILRGSPANLPTLGTNLSGRTVTGCANVGGFLTVTLA